MKICTDMVEDGKLPEVNEVIKAISSQLHDLLAPIISHYEKKSGPADERWYWAALAMLDRKYNRNRLNDWFNTVDMKLSWSSMVRTRDDSDGDFTEHIDYFITYLEGGGDLGRPPRDLLEVLSKISLASPAIVSLRSLLRLPNIKKSYDEMNLFLMTAQVAMGFRTLFNLPESMSLIRSLKPTEDTSYWQSVLGYCVQGNLQSVMDEYVHILRESLGLINTTPEDTIKQIAEEIQKAVALRTVNLDFDEIITSVDKENVELKRHSLRCRYALRFGTDKTEDTGEENRADIVRSAFNSPFRPFVLATTSIGQEGLDFHQYCHEIYHWNLPSNPVDLEQREGRIHRYKGHVIRRNISKKYSVSVLKNRINQLSDPWVEIFKIAKEHRDKEHNDLVPYWIFEFKNCYKIYRYIPALPLSREKVHMGYLRNSLVAYRMILGQPRQEDMMFFLQKRFEDGIDMKELLNFKIDLSPG